MPTYEYECTKCGHRFELFQKISDPPRQRCPTCRSRVKRLLSAGAGLLFKGSGFYTTDYRSESYRKGAKADAPGGAKVGTKKGDGGTAKGTASADKAS